MNNDLLNIIHKYAEDREIDWTAAKIIGEQQGLEFKSESDLLEWKTVVDSYLKTFTESNLQLIEDYIGESKVRLDSDEGYEEYGSGKFKKKGFRPEKEYSSKKKDNRKKEYAKIRSKKRS